MKPFLTIGDGKTIHFINCHKLEWLEISHPINEVGTVIEYCTNGKDNCVHLERPVEEIVKIVALHFASLNAMAE